MDMVCKYGGKVKNASLLETSCMKCCVKLTSVNRQGNKSVRLELNGCWKKE